MSYGGNHDNIELTDEEYEEFSQLMAPIDAFISPDPKAQADQVKWTQTHNVDFWVVAIVSTLAGVMVGFGVGVML